MRWSPRRSATRCATPARARCASRSSTASARASPPCRTTAAVAPPVADDGRGGARPEGGTGLLGLVDRVGALGGTLRISSPVGHGTRLVATIPLAPWRMDSEPFLEFGYEGDGGAGEERIARVMAGIKTVSVSLSREWDLEGGPPRVGQRLPMIDHAGRRRGTVEVLRVAELPFSAIGEDVVAGDAGVASLAVWRARYRAFYDGCRDELAFLLGEPGWRLTDEGTGVALIQRCVGDCPRRAGPRRTLATGPRRPAAMEDPMVAPRAVAIPLRMIVVRASRSSG